MSMMSMMIFHLTVIVCYFCPAFSMELPPLQVETGLNGSLRFSPPPEHHFNVEAPNRISIEEMGKTITADFKARYSKSQVVLVIPSKYLKSNLKASLYICDEKNTYCTKQEKTVNLAEMAFNQKVEWEEDEAKTVKKDSKEEKNSEKGFILNDPEKAFQSAKKENKPIIISFFGIWCPPCNHLEATVLEKREFVSSARDRFILLKLDYDKAVTSEFKKKYSIRGIPTVIFATPDGEEIDRVVGVISLEDMKSRVEGAFKRKDEGYQKLQQLADKGGGLGDKLKASKIAMDRGDFEAVVKWLQPFEKDLREKKEEGIFYLYQARAEGDLKAENVEGVEKTMEQWASIKPHSIELFEFHEKLAELFEKKGRKDDKSKKLNLAAQTGLELLKLPEKDLMKSGYSHGDIHQMLAGVYEDLENKENAKQSYLNCAESFGKAGKAEKNKYPRGPNLERAYCLAKAGSLIDSSAIYRDGIRKFPKEYTYYYYYSRSLLDDHQSSKESLAQVDKAIEFAYGDQRPKAVLLKARVFEKLGQLGQSQEVLENELKKMKMEAEGVYSSRLIAQLEKKLAALKGLEDVVLKKK